MQHAQTCVDACNSGLSLNNDCATKACSCIERKRLVEHEASAQHSQAMLHRTHNRGMTAALEAWEASAEPAQLALLHAAYRCVHDCDHLPWQI